MELVSVQKFMYDTKVSPLKLSTGEAFAFANHTLVASNNLAKVDVQVPATPASGFVMNYTYTYNSKNKPASGTATETPGGAVTSFTYFYK